MSWVEKNKSLPWGFLLVSLVVLLVLGILMYSVPKGELHLLLSGHHNAFMDAIVPHYSNIVTWFPYVLMVVLLFYRAGWAAFLAAEILLSNVIVQPIKEILCFHRPVVWFPENMPDVQLTLTPNVEMMYWCSFPSGHAADFFSTFFVLAFLLHTILTNSDYNLHWQRLGSFFLEMFLALLATFGAYTRIYLSQHFAEDIFAGILISICCTLLLWFLVYPKVRNTQFWTFSLRKLKKCR